MREVEEVRQQLFFEDHLKNFANDRHEADGPRSVVQVFFCDWGYYCMAPIFRNLDNLKGRVKHPGKYSCNVGDNGYKSLREPKNHWDQHPYED